MANHPCTIGNIDVVLDKQIFGPYSAKVALAVERGIDVTGKRMKADTKRDAPVYDPSAAKNRGFPTHRTPGTFKGRISHRRKGRGFGHSYTWYVRSPEYRLTHLLANGHRLYIFGRNTGRSTKADPFLRNAYLKAIAEIRANVIREMPK